MDYFEHLWPAAGCLLLILLAELVLQPRWWAFPLDAVVCGPVVAHLVVAPRSIISRGLSVRPLLWLGQKSYAFYLWHYPIVTFMLLHHVPTLTRAAVGLPASLIASAVSWILVERRWLRVKEGFSHSQVGDPRL